MTLFLLLMVPCLIAILCAGIAVGGKAGFALTLVMLTLQALCIVSYANYKAVSNMPTGADYVMTECDTYDNPGEDVSAMLRAAGWYGIPGDGAERLYSPGC